MKYLKLLDDAAVLGECGVSDRMPRYAVRAILRRSDGLYGVIHTNEFGLYTLPGGGVEKGEEPLQALEREISEEAGCTAEAVLELGIVEENRAYCDFTQINRFYAVEAVYVALPQFTEEEKQRESRLLWLTFDEMCEKIYSAPADTRQKSYIKARDIAALEEYKRLGLDKMEKGQSAQFWDKGYWKKHLDMQKEGKEVLVDGNMLSEKLEKFNVPKGNALDLGCGIGQYTEYLCSLGFDVTALDISRVALEEAGKKAPGARLICRSMTEPLPIDSGSMDLVFACLSIHYFGKRETEKLMAEVHRVLAPGGFFIGSVNTSDAYRIIENDCVRLDEGFYFNSNRAVRLWKREDFDLFFKDLVPVSVEFCHSSRWQSPRDVWEFVYRKR